jgi:hypothetical protein
VLVADSAARSSGRRTSRVLVNAARAGRPYLLVEDVVVDAGTRRAGVGHRWRRPGHGEAAGCFEVQLSADDPEAFTCYGAAGLRPAARTYQQYLPADRR